MPTPRPNEKRTEWMERCVPEVIDDGAAETPAQASAVCSSMWERRNMSRKLRGLHLVGATGEIRTDTYAGRQHIVVPVVALVEGVVKPMGADVAEYVPADVLATAPAGWDGRPVVMDHPTRDGVAISANSPEIKEQYEIGTIFNAHLDGDRLKLEAWIDPKRTLRVDGAHDLVERLQSGDMVEVSVGAFVVADTRDGVAGGEKYGSVWREVIPDHLAMLPEGMEGACSVEMGCGAPRAAMRVTDDGFEALNEEPDMELRNVVLRFASEKKDAVGELIHKLWDEHGMQVELSGANDCDCADPQACECDAPRAASDTPTEPEEEAAMADLSERAKALIRSHRSPFTEADEEFLSGLSADRLAAFEQAAQPQEPEQANPEPVEEEPESEEDTVTIPRDELEDYRAAATAFKRQQAERKEELIRHLRASTDLPSEYLADKDVDELEVLSDSLSQPASDPDYSGRGLPRDSELEDLAAFQPPDPYGLNKQEVN